MAFNFLRRGSLKGEKATAGTSMKANLTPGNILLLTLRFFQMIMGIVVIGLYAQDLVKASKAGVGRDPKWMYATMIGTISTVWAIACAFIKIKAWFFFACDFMAFLLYLVAFGIFGKMYIKEDPEGNKGIVRMKNAVWILLVNMLLWFITGCYGAFVFWNKRKALTTHTGRANMNA